LCQNGRIEHIDVYVPEEVNFEIYIKILRKQYHIFRYELFQEVVIMEKRTPTFEDLLRRRKIFNMDDIVLETLEYYGIFMRKSDTLELKKKCFYSLLHIKSINNSETIELSELT
jgi:hypothetical protein